NRLMGWVGKNERLTPREIDLFNRYEDYIESLMEKIIMIPGPQNPTGMKKFVEDVYAKKHGTLDTTNKYVPKYIPNNNNLITLIITDHIGLTKYETGLTSKKAVIDKSSEHKQRWRDLYGFSPIDVSQFNRDIANPIRLKSGDIEPMLEDFKDSSSTQENSDIVLSLFDVMRYANDKNGIEDPSGYDLGRLRDSKGNKKYRNLKILKNSYGSDDVRIGLAFQPEVGYFKEMKKRSEIRDEDYANIID